MGMGVVAAALALTLSVAPTVALMAPDRLEQGVALPPDQVSSLSPHVFSRSALTSEGSPFRYARGAGDRVVVRASRADPDENRREVFSKRGARITRNQTSCATWVEGSNDLVQEGLAVRIVDQGGRVRAITLTKNTVFHWTWVFNIVSWDTARQGDPWRMIDQFDMGSALSTTALNTSERGVEPFPWRVCLRVSGGTIALKLWLPGRMDRPSWRDPAYTRRTELPAAFDMAGKPGWYVGHLPAGDSVVYADLHARQP